MKTIISVGAFSPTQVATSLRAGYSVTAYEPRKDVYEAYRKIEHLDFRCFPQAVSGKAGRVTFYEHGGCSTICPMTNPTFEIDDSYFVDVVSMNDVLSLHGDVHNLALNCEGSEISIIMDTPIESFEKCKNISIEFHKFCEYFNFSEKDINECVKKLEKKFKSRLVSTKQPYYSFVKI